jgi:hypothetical protein
VSDANAMLAAAQAMPGVKYAALSDSTTVAITYQDGTHHIIALLPLNDPGNVSSSSLSASSAHAVQPRVTENFLPAPGPSGGRGAYLYNAITTQSFKRIAAQNVDSSNWPVGPLSSWIQNAGGGTGYSVTNDLQAVADLGAVKHASVFFAQAHGGYFEDDDGTITFALATPYPDSPSIISQFTSQLDSDEMGFFSYADYQIDPFTHQMVFSLGDLLYMTPDFVKANLSFTANSVVFLNACSLMVGVPFSGIAPAPATLDKFGVASQAMVQAFFDAGAGALLGWDNTVNSVQAAESAMYFFDRVLGAGAQGVTGGYPVLTGAPGGYGGLAPGSNFLASPANRPFDVVTIFQQMHTKPRTFDDQPISIYSNVQNMFSISNINLDEAVVVDIDQDPATGLYNLSPNAQANEKIAFLRMMLNPKNTGAPSLMPTISGLAVQNDKQQLTITGDFGGPYTTRSITIGGNPVPATWTDGTIIVPLPFSGAGSSGNILVTIDDLKSNHVLLNQWNGVPFQLTINGGSTSQTINCSINLRASFDTLRQSPDFGPTVVPYNPVSTDDAVLQNGTCTFVATNPSGSGSIPWSPITQAFPISGTGANAIAQPTADGDGGGTMVLSFQAGYIGGMVSFLDTTATNGPGQQLVFDDTAQNLAAGTSSLTGVFQWSPTAGLSPDNDRAR